MERSPEMQKFLTDFQQSSFGRKANGSKCVVCGNVSVKRENFKDDVSFKEFDISGMCQKCQDQIFG